MSTECPAGRPQGQVPDNTVDSSRTGFGLCMDAARDIARTPHVRAYAGAPPVPTRPYPDPSLTDQGTAGEGVPSTSGASFRTTPTLKVSGRCACARECDCLTRKAPRRARRDDWTAKREVWHHLTAGLSMLSLNDFGRPWPNPRRDDIAQLVDHYGADVCVEAAEETRRIVQRDDRAPNITALLTKKCADVQLEREAEVEQESRRESVREEIRRALA